MAGRETLLVYNGLLLVVAAIAAFGLRTTLEGRIAITWFALLWVLSVVHLIEGLRNVPVLSLLSYTLYSMALHAYHVPLAVLVAWWMSPHTALTPVSEEATASVDHAICCKVGRRGIGAGWRPRGPVGRTQSSSHEELLAVSPGDLVLRDALGSIDGAVYTENMHWGYLWNAPATVAVTSIPTLGLVHIDSSQHAAATQAMFYDNTSFFLEHNMLHALTSPMGTMQWTLAIVTLLGRGG